MPIPIRYEFDATGVSRDNFIAAETRVILLNRKRRVVAPYCSPYYTESMQIKDNTTGQFLIKGQDWQPVDFHEFAMRYTGKEIASIVVITNPSVSKDITLSYQTVGGPFANNAEIVKQQIDALELDNRPVHFDKILNKPHGYNPAHHLHHIGDIYGFEFITTALERIRQAIQDGDWDRWAAIYKYVDDEIAKVRGIDPSILEEFKLHIRNKNNPHETTVEATGGYRTTVIDGMVQAVNDKIDGLVGEINKKLSKVATDLNDHIHDYNNPHRNITETDVRNILKDYYDKAEIDALLAKFKGGGGTVDLTDLWNAINGHIADRNNPHKLTIGGLGGYAKTETYNQTEIDAKFKAIVDLRDPATGKIRNIYIPISKMVNNQVQLFNDGLYVGDQTDKKYAVSHVDAINGEDSDTDPLAGTAAKPYKTLGYALSLGLPNAKREIRLAEGQTHYVTLPDGGNFGDKTACEVRGGLIDILPYGPRTAVISDPPMQTKFKRSAVRQLNTKLVFRGVEIWGSSRNLLRMNSLLVSLKGMVRFWGLTLINQIPEMCYSFNTAQYSMTTYLGRLDYNSDGFIELHNCAIDTGGKDIDQAIPGIASRKTKDYVMFLSTRDTPSISIAIEGSIADDGRTWDRTLKITGNNNCFDFYTKYTTKLLVDDYSNAAVSATFSKYIRKPNGYANPPVFLGNYYNVDTNIIPNANDIKASLQQYLN